ncbi:MAG TPA: hypothetical protein ENK11_10870, partial [Phycisphaerales bacterium]|nr:hypothetical protein [Phycisphaerales bacterium]
ERHFIPVKRRVSPRAPLALGLWIPQHTTARHPIADALAAFPNTPAVSAKGQAIDALAGRLTEIGLEAVTFNAFPQHDFHRPVVKHAVYEPDWADEQRFIHTLAVAGHLSRLQPTRGGSISTLPVGWPTGNDRDRIEKAGDMLRRFADVLHKNEQQTGTRITLDLEPEPGCILDTADDVVAFFDEHLPEEIHRTHIGICHDVCHAAVMFEDQRETLRRYADAGVRVHKVQISSALDVDVKRVGGGVAIEHLRPFAEPRYLHQTGFKTGDAFELVEDLPEAIDRLERGETPDRLRVHFHVPVSLDTIGPLGTTNNQIAAAVTAAREFHGTQHFEVETYAWGVLPDELKRDTLADGIADELRWVLETNAPNS